ncbi:MAG: helix-turn-helix domain-containing protein [Pyrinomonadaceae bacterium]
MNTKLYSAVAVEYHDQVKAFGLSGLLGFLRDLVAPKEFRPKRAEKPPGQRLNFTDACEFFGVGTSTLYRWIREGRVPFYRPGREYQFDRDELVLIGRQDLSGNRKAVVKLSPLTIGKNEPKSKKEEHSRYRKMLKLD